MYDLLTELIFFHSSSQKERVMSVFKRQLAVPLLGTEEFINHTILLFMHISLMSIANNFMYSCFEKGCPIIYSLNVHVYHSEWYDGWL